tara:strand:- start:3420 stop:4049 length:630 start_codon:yes stop_codon:yes gene_type:complete
MWGKVENKKVIKIYKNPEIIRDASGTQYPTAIFNNDTRLADFSIYPITDANLKPNIPILYSGIGESYSWNEKNSKIERTYNFSQKDLADADAVDDKGKKVLDENGKQVINLGIKSILKKEVKQIQASMLSNTDKWIIRKADTGDDIPATVVTYRKSIRDTATSMEKAITDAKDFDAIVSLLTPVLNSDDTIKTPPTLFTFPDVPDGMPD